MIDQSREPQLQDVDDDDVLVQDTLNDVQMWFAKHGAPNVTSKLIEFRCLADMVEMKEKNSLR